ncbi:C-X-C motif chemokine 15-like isoform X2 [Cervus elaphus]|uniref:C-X-C motif chemokine 15-like isoform X2 n=1 Tax=Cervus canadensis TaxID=1574408 RepID=UPI0018BA5BFE|nr:C-X-C motif chemokine 15-like isoform X2 [Cervus canadensis]XP_043761782.1 C-X-C motif chemokine 15-like isoform X2 [Cervus elaphus]
MATESSQMFLLLAVFVLGIFADPCESQELRCQCIQTQSDFIPPKFIAKFQIIPEGAHCNRKEIIVTLKDGKLICLDPEAEWVMNIIKKIVRLN